MGSIGSTSSHSADTELELGFGVAFCMLGGAEFESWSRLPYTVPVGAVCVTVLLMSTGGVRVGVGGFFESLLGGVVVWDRVKGVNSGGEDGWVATTEGVGAFGEGDRESTICCNSACARSGVISIVVWELSKDCVEAIGY